MKKPYALALFVAAVSIVAVSVFMSGSTNVVKAEDKPQAAQPDKAAVERSRKAVQLLDNIFKQTVILITDKYVHDESDFAAGSAATLLFKNVSEAGDTKVRLLDATGDPYDEENVAKDDFEREGIKRLKAGDQLYEQVVSTNGTHQLRTLTAVPVIMQKCVMCHAHYAHAKKGEAIGAISYIVPIE